MDIIEIIKESTLNFFQSFAEFLPRLIGGLIILFIGWIIAKIVSWGIAKFLKAIKFENLSNRLGINGFLVRGGVKKSSSKMIANLFYWLIMCIVLGLFFNSLGLEVVTELFNKIVLYIPNVIVACVLLVIGFFLGDFVKNFSTVSLKGAGFEHAETAGNVFRGVILFFVAGFILTQLGIGEEIVKTIIQALLGGLGLAFALAFGLGGREWAGDIIEKYLGKK